MSERFPWARLMRLGLGELRLAPREFWSMTLKELAAALPVPAALAREDLDRLMKRFPDD
jgi:uncharacterized phage protein (TIGR02216 family)